MRFTRFHVSGLLLAFLAPVAAHAASTYYVAPGGSDGANGAMGTPWATWNHAQTVVAAGDTVYFRAGKYVYNQGTTKCSSETATIDGIQLNKSGSAGNTINYFAYPGEVPVFDFTNMLSMDISTMINGCRAKGVEVTGSYIYLKGLEIMGAPQQNMLNHESWGVWISGSHNTFEMLNLHNNMGPGLFIQKGGNNLVLNCDSHDNYDPNTSNGAGQSADGFGCHTTDAAPTGSNNVFRGCRAWRNSDDCWDFINASATCTVEQSWAWQCGYALINGTLTSPAAGNGNGFKGGGYGSPPAPPSTGAVGHIVRQCLSVGNKASGFYANHQPPASPTTFYNNTGYGNNPNFNMLGEPNNTGILRNNLAVSKTATSNMGGSVVEDHNSWDALGVTANDADFQSVSLTGLDAPRQADGSLPNIANFHLVAGSDLIDKGTNVGLPFAGSAPDLGAFETGLTTGSGGVGGAGMGGAGMGGAGMGGAGMGGAGMGGAGMGGAGMGGAGMGGAGMGGVSGAGTAGMGTAGAGTAGAGTAGSGTAGAGTAGAGTAGAGTAGAGTAGAGTAGAGTAGAGTAGAGTAGAGTAGAGTAGAGTAGAGTAGVGTAGVGTAGVGVAGSSGGAVGTSGDTGDTGPGAVAANQPGCSCRVAGGQTDASTLGSWSLLGLLGLALGRRKRRA